MEKSKLVLEPSTNTHTLEAQSIKETDLGKGMLVLEIEGDGIVTHGEHAVIKTESKKVAKYVQQEFNPVTRQLQNAFD